jgi:hypothetical protein
MNDGGCCDIDPPRPLIATTTFGTAALGIKSFWSIRVSSWMQGTNGNLVIVDISSATSSVVVSTSPAGKSAIRRALCGGRYIYVVNRLSDSLNVYDQGGLETTALTAATAEFGSLSVLGNAIRSVAVSISVTHSLSGLVESSAAGSAVGCIDKHDIHVHVRRFDDEPGSSDAPDGGWAEPCVSRTGTGCPIAVMAIWTESTDFITRCFSSRQRAMC